MYFLLCDGNRHWKERVQVEDITCCSGPCVYLAVPCLLISLTVHMMPCRSKINLLYHLLTYSMAEQPFQGSWPHSNTGICTRFNLVALISDQRQSDRWCSASQELRIIRMWIGRFSLLRDLFVNAWSSLTSLKSHTRESLKVLLPRTLWPEILIDFSWVLTREPWVSPETNNALYLLHKNYVFIKTLFWNRFFNKTL